MERFADGTLTLLERFAVIRFADGTLALLERWRCWNADAVGVGTLRCYYASLLVCLWR